VQNFVNPYYETLPPLNMDLLFASVSISNCGAKSGFLACTCDLYC